MKTNNYKNTHIRIFDKSGLIFSASPNIDAYELSRTVLDILQNQKTEPAYMAMMREEYANIFCNDDIADAIATVREKYDNVEIFTQLNRISAQMRQAGISEEFLFRYLDVNEPLPTDGDIELNIDILNAKIYLHIVGLTRYDGRRTPDSDRAKFASLNTKLLSFDVSEYQNVADILSSNVLYEGTDWCTPEEWATDRHIIEYREMLDIINSISEPVIFDAPTGEYVYDVQRIYAADKTDDADDGIIKAKQCLECGSMNTMDAGSGAGCCNACGCWIPDYNNAKRLTGE